MSIFSTLPLVLVDLILSYDTIISARNGKYINRIDNNDYRKELLEKIPKKHNFIWPDRDIVTTVTLHINFTKYYVIDYKNYILTIGILVHSGIDYNNPYPADSDESTQIEDLYNIQIM